jgi:cytochrome P450
MVFSGFDPLDPEVVANPYPAYAALRKHAPVYEVPANGLWVVSRYRDALTVLRRPELFTSEAMRAAVTRPGEFTPDRDDAPADEEEAVSIVGSDGARHVRLRGVMNRGFTPARIAALAPMIRTLAEQLAAPLFEAGRCEFLEDFATPLPAMVIAEMLGVDPERRRDFRRWSDASMSAVFEPIEGLETASLGEAITEMSEYFQEVIEARRHNPGDDLISTLIRAEAGEAGLTPLEIQVFVFTLLVAGSVTTTHLLANALVALLSHPEELAKVVRDPRRIPGFVEEALRYDTPVHLLFRTAGEDVELSGTTIPQGATLGVLFGSANRDETIFPEPDRFDVDRHPKDHLAFGNGIHFCLGAALARLEARVAFEVLLERIREPVLEETQLHYLRSLIFRGPQRLRISFQNA